MVEEKSKGELLAERFIQAGKNAKQREANMVLVRKALAEEKLAGAKPTKREIKDFTKNYKKQTEGRRAYADIRYKKSASGRILAGFRAIQNPIATLYRRNMTLNQQKELSKRDKENKKTAKGNFKQQMQERKMALKEAKMDLRYQQMEMRGQPRYRQPIPQPENDFDWIFSNFANPRTDTASMIEKEVMNSANGGASNMGDKMAFQLGREANFSVNLMIPNHLVNIDREVSKHSRLQHINPVFDIEKETNFFSRLLD